MKLRILLVLVAATHAVSLTDPIRKEWNMFKLRFAKKYNNDKEDDFRMKTYTDNKHKIDQHNKKYEEGLVSFKMGMNKYGDMPRDEFNKKMTGYASSISSPYSDNAIAFNFAPFVDDDDNADDTNATKNSVSVSGNDTSNSNLHLSRTVDWRKKGAVTRVKDQGECGSCWAFSATGSLESQWFLKSQKLISLSEQNLIDCSSQNGNDGCEGGRMENAWTYIKMNNGIDTENSYPYEGKERRCRYKVKNKATSVKGFINIDSGTEKDLQKAVAAFGPVSVAIDASNDSFQFYSSGVYNESKCRSGPTDLGHGVLAVGYGVAKKGGPYWIIKNSWGTDWGMKGYILIARNQNNMCGVATMAGLPVV